LFAQNNEYGIDEFGQFTHYEQKRPHPGHTVGVARVADRIDNSMLENGVQKLGPHANHADDAERGERQIPHNQRHSQLEAGSIGHDSLAREYDEHVQGREEKAQLPVRLHPQDQRVDKLVRLEFALERKYVPVGGHVREAFVYILAAAAAALISTV
jgi:hypothetical protein